MAMVQFLWLTQCSSPDAQLTQLSGILGNAILPFKACCVVSCPSEKSAMQNLWTDPLG